MRSKEPGKKRFIVEAPNFHSNYPWTLPRSLHGPTAESITAESKWWLSKFSARKVFSAASLNQNLTMIHSPNRHLCLANHRHRFLYSSSLCPLPVDQVRQLKPIVGREQLEAIVRDWRPIVTLFGKQLLLMSAVMLTAGGCFCRAYSSVF